VQRNPALEEATLLPDTDNLPKPEELLNDYARRLERHRAGRTVLWLELSQLARENRHPSDIQLAANLMAPLAKRFHGEVFALGNADVVVCLKEPKWKEVETVLFDLKFSLAHDPLMKRADTEGNSVFLKVYDIGEAYEAFRARTLAGLRTDDDNYPVPPAPANDQPNPTARLVFSREEMIRRARSQGIAGHVDTPQGRIAVERLLDRHTIGTLSDSLKPKHWGYRESVNADALDAFDQIATMFARRQISEAQAFAEVERNVLPGLASHLGTNGAETGVLALHLEALMSPEFLLFERQMAELGPSRPGILMRVEELDLDPETGAYIRNVLRQFGYAVGICGINLGVAARNVDLLTGFDLVEITHTSEIGIEDAKRLASVIAKLGAKRAILTGMRTEAQLKAARQAGAQFVAGPIVDALA
jgi:hypothetical protein